jgi:predicted ArsR family transcriptional regulator
MDSVAAAVSPAQHNVLVALKRRGEATADDLAAELDVSSSAVRQHLGSLRAAALVDARKERGRRGRPAELYHTTERAENLFAPSDAALVAELLDDLSGMDPSLVGQLFEHRRQRLESAAAERLADAGIAERVGVITELLAAQGHLADACEVEPGRYRIELHSCAFWNVASRHRQVCTSEMDLLRDLLPGADVERVSHRTNGAHVCAYEIRVHDAQG